MSKSSPGQTRSYTERKKVAETGFVMTKTCPGPRQLIRRPEAALSGNGSHAFYRQGLRFCPLKDAVYEIGGSTIGPSIKRPPLFDITAQPETRGIFKLLATVIMRSRFSTASASENAAIASGGFALTAASAWSSSARFAVLRKSSPNPSSCASRNDQPVPRPRHHVMGRQSPRRGGPMALARARNQDACRSVPLSSG